MKFKILCAANDVGGGNLISIIAPLLLSNLDYEIFFAAAGETLIKWKNEYFIKEIRDSPYNVIKNNQPDLIITGASLCSDFERKIWSIARNLNIPTFAMIDGWFKIIDRLKNNCGRQILPDIIGVSDYKVAEELTQTLNNILKRKIYIIGHPHLQSSVKKIKSLRKCNNMNASKNVLFLSSPIYGNEADYGIITLKEIVPYLERYFPDYKIIIRPHFSENKISWIDFCTRFNNTSSLKVIIDHETPINIQLSTTRLLLGLPTTTMLQGAFSDIPSLVFKFALNDYHNLATDYYLSNHTVNYVDEIENAFQLITCKPSLPQIVYDELINYSISNSMEAISSIINLITLNYL